MAAPATAQTVEIGASLAVESNQMFRGESISGDSPGVTAGLNLEGPLGLYAGADLSLGRVGGDVRMTGNALYGGVAVRLGKVSVEVGGVHRHYREVVDTDYDTDYSEVYLGLARGHSRLRLYLSRDYNIDHKLTGYVEAETRLAAYRDWSLDGHLGISFVPQDPGATTNFPRVYEDWRLTLGRRIGSFNCGLSLGSANYPVFVTNGRVRAALAMSRAF